MPGSHWVVEKVWDSAIHHSRDRDYSLMSAKDQKSILNFFLNVCPPRRGRQVCCSWTGAAKELSRRIPYEVFLQLEGRKVFTNPYTNEILKAPIMLPGEGASLLATDTYVLG